MSQPLYDTPQDRARALEHARKHAPHDDLPKCECGDPGWAGHENRFYCSDCVPKSFFKFAREHSEALRNGK